MKRFCDVDSFMRLLMWIKWATKMTRQKRVDAMSVINAMEGTGFLRQTIVTGTIDAAT